MRIIRMTHSYDFGRQKVLFFKNERNHPITQCKMKGRDQKRWNRDKKGKQKRSLSGSFILDFVS